jgi:hypothetical protein
VQDGRVGVAGAAGFAAADVLLHEGAGQGEPGRGQLPAPPPMRGDPGQVHPAGAVPESESYTVGWTIRNTASGAKYGRLCGSAASAATQARPTAIAVFAARNT